MTNRELMEQSAKNMICEQKTESKRSRHGAARVAAACAAVAIVIGAAGTGVAVASANAQAEMADALASVAESVEVGVDRLTNEQSELRCAVYRIEVARSEGGGILFEVVPADTDSVQYETQYGDGRDEQYSLKVVGGDRIVWNEVDGAETALSPDWAANAAGMKTMSLDEVCAYYGFGLDGILLPDGLEADWDGAAAANFYVGADGFALFDSVGLSWHERVGSDEYDPTERLLILSYGASATPADTVFVEERAASSVGGVEMTLGIRDEGYGPYTEVEDGPNEPAGYVTWRTARFELGGVQFELSGRNLGEDEFLRTLRSLVASLPAGYEFEPSIIEDCEPLPESPVWPVSVGAPEVEAEGKDSTQP